MQRENILPLYCLFTLPESKKTFHISTFYHSMMHSTGIFTITCESTCCNYNLTLFGRGNIFLDFLPLGQSLPILIVIRGICTRARCNLDFFLPPNLLHFRIHVFLIDFLYWNLCLSFSFSAISCNVSSLVAFVASIISLTLHLPALVRLMSK